MPILPSHHEGREARRPLVCHRIYLDIKIHEVKAHHNQHGLAGPMLPRCPPPPPQRSLGRRQVHSRACPRRHPSRHAGLRHRRPPVLGLGLGRGLHRHRRGGAERRAGPDHRVPALGPRRGAPPADRDTRPDRPLRGRCRGSRSVVRRSGAVARTREAAGPAARPGADAGHRGHLADHRRARRRRPRRTRWRAAPRARRRTRHDGGRRHGPGHRPAGPRRARTTAAPDTWHALRRCRPPCPAAGAGRAPRARRPCAATRRRGRRRR